VLPWVLLIMASLALSACVSDEDRAPETSSAASPVSQPAEGTESPEHASNGHAHEGDESAPHHHDEADNALVPLTAIERENIGLKTVAATLQPLEEVRRFPGVIKPHPDRVAFVTSRTPGKVIAIHAKLGERVARGQDLIDIQSIEVEKLELELIQVENKSRAERSKLELELSQAENKLRLVQAEADRNRALVDKQVGARKDLLAAESELQAVKNDIAGVKRQLQLLAQASQNELEGLTRQLSLFGLSAQEIERVRREKSSTLLHMPAPLGGVVVERPVSLGQVIDTTTTLFKIIDDSVVIAEGDAFEDVLPSLQVGQHVRLTTPAYPKRIFEGTLTLIHPVIDPDKRTVDIWAEILNADHALKPDMFAQIHVVVGGGHPVVTVPLDAVLAAEGEEFVFVERDGGLARTQIAIGARNDQFVEVKRGLKAGDRVVTDGKRQVYTKLLVMRAGGPAMGGHTH
jgi:membrane fusion protein, heavy metal efflux system